MEVNDTSAISKEIKNDQEVAGDNKGVKTGVKHEFLFNYTQTYEMQEHVGELYIWEDGNLDLATFPKETRTLPKLVRF